MVNTPYIEAYDITCYLGNIYDCCAYLSSIYTDVIH